MDKEQLMKNAKLLQSVLLTYTLGEMSDEHLKGNLKTIANNINPNIMDMHIKFYSKAEGCSFANRFNGYMTLAHLIKGIDDNQFEVVKQKEFSQAFGQDIPARALNLMGNKAQAVVLEDGTRITFVSRQRDLTWYRIEQPDPAWAEVLNKECIKKEDADPNFKLIP